MDLYRDGWSVDGLMDLWTTNKNMDAGTDFNKKGFTAWDACGTDG